MPRNDHTISVSKEIKTLLEEYRDAMPARIGRQKATYNEVIFDLLTKAKKINTPQ